MLPRAAVTIGAVIGLPRAAACMPPSHHKQLLIRMATCMNIPGQHTTTVTLSP